MEAHGVVIHSGCRQKVSATPSLSHRLDVSLFTTQMQPLEIFLPFQVNLNLAVESSHVSQAPQVKEHIAATPSSSQRLDVSLFATQEVEPLEIYLPCQVNLNLAVESSQLEDVVSSVGEAAGATVSSGFVGEAVGITVSCSFVGEAVGATVSSSFFCEAVGATISSNFVGEAVGATISSEFV